MFSTRQRGSVKGVAWWAIIVAGTSGLSGCGGEPDPATPTVAPPAAPAPVPTLSPATTGNGPQWGEGQMLPGTTWLLTPLKVDDASLWPEEQNAFPSGVDWAAILRPQRDGSGGPARSLTTTTSAWPIGSGNADTRVLWHNAMLQNLGTASGERHELRQRLVLPRRGMISRFVSVMVTQPNAASTPEKPLPPEVVTSGTVFVATMSDANRDETLTADDRQVAFIIDNRGAHSMTIPPAGGKVLGVRVLDSQPIVLISFRVDRNRDGTFDVRDGREIWMYDLLDPQRRPSHVLSDDLKRTAERLVEPGR